jgi:hypothetical protein
MALKTVYLILFGSWILAASGTSVFAQTFQWVRQIGGTGWDEGTAIKTDQDNNVYTVGLFIGTVDFDPGAGVFNLTSVGEKDAFICKLDAAGNFLWAKHYGDSSAIDQKSSLAIDLSGNLYITNSFLGTADFDPGPGSFPLTCPGSDRAVFIQKLDADGNFIWAKQIGAPFVPAFPTPVHANAIAVDAGGDLYLTGYFDGTPDFDPDAASTYTMTSQFNASDAFVCKLDTDGNFVWAKQFTGTQSNGGVGYAIAVDGSGNVYSTGTIGGAVDFDPGPGTFYLTTSVAFQTEIYVSKLDASGAFAWAKAMGPGEGSAIAVDVNDRIYSSGWAPSGYAAAVNKHNAAGTLLWTKPLGGLNGQSIALDNTGHVYTTGMCFGTNDFDPGPGVFNLTGGNSDSYVSKLDTSGMFVWAGLLTGTGQVWVNAVTTDSDNAIYTAGYFNDTADFDPSASLFNLTSPAIGYDLYIHKLSETDVTGLAEHPFEGDMHIYPNPTEGHLTVAFDSEQPDFDLVLSNMLGQVIPATCVRIHNRIELQIDDASGMYLLEIADREGHRVVVRVVKQ